MTFPKLSGFIHFSKTFPGLEIAVLKFHDFSRFFMTVRTLYGYECTISTYCKHFSHFYHRIRKKIFVTLEHKTSLKCSNSQKYIVWVKMIDLSFMP